MLSHVEFTRYLQLLKGDAGRVADMARRGLDAPVPSCPGWRVDDVVRHLSQVYLHKIECMRQQAAPKPWPPDLSHREPLTLFDESFGELVRELESRGPRAPSYTWYPADQTVGFWYRRMAQETAVHRVDVELAHGAATPVDPDLAVDGIDEVLSIMLAGDWSDEPVDEAAGRTVRVTSADRWWRIALDRTSVVCEPRGSAATDVIISGQPSDVLLWLWGRGPLDRLVTSGDQSVVSAFRDRLARATQ